MKNQSIKHPETWRDDFMRQSLRTAFTLHLTQPMIEFLCAIAANCRWDRGRAHNIHAPDNWIATETALEKRGLIRRKDRAEIDAVRAALDAEYPDLRRRFNEGPAFSELTPAGERVVELFKTVGMFVEMEATVNRRKHKARGA